MKIEFISHYTTLIQYNEYFVGEDASSETSLQSHTEESPQH